MIEIPTNELVFTTTRSSGPGGQNVNKVNSKVTLKFDVNRSSVFTNEQKEIISRKLASWMTKDGVIMVTAQESRSQIQNKEAVIEKLRTLLLKALVKPKVRKPTKPSKASVRNRINKKKQTSEKKKWRQKPDS